jgi:hypothetical protein
MKVCRVGTSFVWSAGQVVEVPDDEARRLVRAKDAEFVDPDPHETATARPTVDEVAIVHPATETPEPESTRVETPEPAKPANRRKR